MAQFDQNKDTNFTNDANDSKFNNSEHFTEKKKKTGPVLALIALTLSIGAGGGFLAANSGNKTPENGDGSEVVVVTTEATTEIITEATTTAATSAEATSETTEVAGSLEIFEAIVSVEAMEAMSIEEFAQLSYVDRATYAYTLLDLIPVGKLDEEFNPKKVVGFYWQQLNLNSLSQNTTVGAKCLSALDYDTYDQTTGTFTASFKSDIKYINDYGGTDHINDHSFTYIDSGEPQTWIDTDVLSATGEMKNLDYTNVTYIIETSDGQKTNEVTVQVFQIPIKLPDGRTIVAYPRGYSIEGKASPITGKNY